jgi:teichuronic acid exporter
MVTPAQVLSVLRWTAIARAGAQLCTWVITIIVVRLLSPADYGLMGMAAILMGLCLLINELGAVPALIQRSEIDERLIRQVFGLVLVSNAALYMIAYLGAPAFADFFNEPRLVAIVRVLALQLVIGAAATIPTVLLQRDLKFKWISLIEFGAAITGALATLALALGGSGVWALVYGNLVTAAINAVGLVSLTRFHIKPLFDFSGLNHVLLFGLKVSGQRLIWYGNRNFAGLLIGKVLGDLALGIFSAAETLALLPASKVMGLINQIAFAAYSRVQDDRDRVRHYFLESTRLAAFILFPVAWGLSAVAEDFVDVVLGAPWHNAAIVLQIIALGVPYRALGLMVAPLVDGLGRPGLGLQNNLTITLIVPCAVVAGLHWGLVGMCVADLVGNVLATTVVLRRSLVLCEAELGTLLSVLAPTVLSAAIMYVTVHGAQATLANGMAAAWRLPTMIALGMTVYLALTLVVNRPLAIRSLELIRGKI